MPTQTEAEPLTLFDIEVEEPSIDELFNDLVGDIHIRHLYCQNCQTRVCDGLSLGENPKPASRSAVPCDTCSSTEFVFIHRRKCRG